MRCRADGDNAGTRKRLYAAAAAVLLVGLGGALQIYLSAERAADSDLVSGYLNSKSYLHEVKRYGGNASVLADRFSRWFDGLWEGEQLAFTVAWISVMLSGLLAFAGYHSPPDAPAGRERPDPT